MPIEENQEYGATHLVVADVIEESGELERYRNAIPGAEIFVVRLRASLEALAQRIGQREVGSGLQWHLARAPALAQIMERNKGEDLLVETDDTSIRQIAEAISGRVAATSGKLKQIY